MPVELNVARIKFTLLIPMNYGDGTKVPDPVLHEIYNELYTLAGGYTLAGAVTGAYRMKDGSKQVDHSTAIWIGIEESQEALLRQLVAEICGRLKQETIYLERTGGTIEFIPPPNSGEKP
jgi:hypothetical protein